MNKEAIDTLIANNPKLAGARAKLEAMAPGNYCLHRSWGFGKIVDFCSMAFSTLTSKHFLTSRNINVLVADELICLHPKQ
ncbi:MAG: hypothetical protein ACPGES_13370, partial [Coraliomargarita sp.]